MISTKARYALRVMIDLAEHQDAGYIPLKDIAARQEISEKYLEIIIKILVKGKMLKGLRGKGGIIHAITCHSYNIAFPLPCFYNSNLVFRCHSGID